MRRLLVLTVAIVAGLMTITPPAQAKFVVRVVIDGLGLLDPVELPNTAVRIGCTFSRYCHPLSDPPGGPLGPRYQVIQSLEGHTPRGRMMDRIVHYLYPYAQGGPQMFTPAGQTWHDWNHKRRVAGGWTRGPKQLIDALRAAGLPEQPPQQPVRAAAIHRSVPRASAAHDGTAWAWVVPVALAALFAGGLLLPWPRRRARTRRD